MEFLAASLLELVIQTSTNLPPDVRAAMSLAARRLETPGTQSSQALDIILQNIDMAADDAGRHLPGHRHADLRGAHARGREPDRDSGRPFGRPWRKPRGCGKLRPNSVDSITGKNSGNNLGEETPVMHFEQWEEDEIEVKLILKGGGCENKNIQYSVPCESRPPGPRRPQPGRRAQVHSARGVAGAGAGLRAGRARACASAATARTATNWPRGNSSARWTT